MVEMMVNGQKPFKKPLTAGQLAKLIGFSKKSVLNWIHSGAIKAHRTEGRHFRVWPADVHEFIMTRQLGIPFKFVDVRFPQAVIYDIDSRRTAIFQQIMKEVFDHVKCEWTINPLYVAFRCADVHPNYLFIHPSIDSSEAFHLGQILIEARKRFPIKVIVLGQPGPDLQFMKPQFFDDVILEPWSAVVSNETLSKLSKIIK